MKRTITALLFLSLSTSQISAGSVGGTGGALEVTQIANNVQLGLQYAKQIQQYVMQGLQYKTQLQNLIEANAPGFSEVMGIINGISQMMAVGKSIGGSLEQIDRNFAATFKNATAANLAENFTRWNNSSLDTLQGALRAAGKHRDRFPNDAAMLQDLYVTSQATQGTRDALQMVAAINSEQVSQLQKLGDLVATQNIATSTYMANLTSQSQDQIRTDKAIRDGAEAIRPTEAPTFDKTPKVYKPLNVYPPK